MPQLRSCYFCGAVGDSLQEYEVVPDRLVASGESQSAVLCSSCQEKLRRVLEPLVEAAESAESPGTSGPDPGASGVGEVTFESASPAPEEVADDAPAATDGRDDDETSDADGDEWEATGDEDADVDQDEDVPDGYYKVLRLLQNREFPMERADLTALVTGAYDVSEPQCDRILETAIERGVLVEDGSMLDIGGD